MVSTQALKIESTETGFPRRMLGSSWALAREAARMMETVRAGDGSDSGGSRSQEADPAGRSQRPRLRIEVRSLVMLGIGVGVVALGWRIIWESKHPAAASARKIQQGDAGARVGVIHQLEGFVSIDPEVAIPA